MSGIGQVLELHRHPGIWNLLHQLLGLPDRPNHAVRGRCEHQLCPIREEQDAPFQTHALRHGENQAVTARGRDPGERNAGIAAGWFDDGGLAGCDQSSGFRVEDHGDANAVFDREAGRECLQLAQQPAGRVRRKAIEPDERGVPDQLGCVVGDRGACSANEVGFG